MIPKILHRVWIGEKGKSSWLLKIQQDNEQKMTYWQNIYWNDKKIKKLKLVKKNYLKKLRNNAEKVDYIRFCILWEFWGVYLDYDYSVLKKIDPLLQDDFFIWKEASGMIWTAIIWCKKNSSFVKNIIKTIELRIQLTRTQNMISTDKIWPWFLTKIILNWKKYSEEKITVYESALLYPSKKESIKKWCSAYGFHYEYWSWMNLYLKYIYITKKMLLSCPLIGKYFWYFYQHAAPMVKKIIYWPRK